MTQAHQGRPSTDFPRPSGIVVADVDPVTGLLPRAGQTNTVAEEFLDGTVPVQVAPEPIPPAVLLPGSAPAVISPADIPAE